MTPTENPTFEKNGLSNQSKYWLIELFAFLASATVAVLVVLPIYSAAIPFDFMEFNLLFVIVGLTFSRYIFYLNIHPLRRSRIFKVLIIFSVPFLFFPLLEGMHSFLQFNDTEGLQSILTHLPYKQQSGYMRYIRLEYLFFGVVALAGSFFVIVKMIRSLWRQYKYDEI